MQKSKRKFTVVIEKDEAGWYVSEVVELPGCHTQAKSIDQLIQRTKEAMIAYQDFKTPQPKTPFSAP